MLAGDSEHVPNFPNRILRGWMVGVSDETYQQLRQILESQNGRVTRLKK